MGHGKRQRRDALTVGAAAGLAAAFNTPLAAITFVLEELVGDLGSRYLGGVVLASVTGALVVQASIGRQPAFELPNVDSASWMHYLLVPLVAVLATLCGIAFEKLALASRGRLMKQQRIPRWILPLIGGALTWCLAVSAFLATGKTGVFGLGYDNLSEALSHGIAWRVAGVLAAAKILATVCSYGFGGCGGIFSPTLFIGGMCGFFVSGVCAHWIDLPASDRIVLSAVGMCTCLCAVIRAPLTSMLIVFEMTHQFALVPALMLGVILCEGVTRLFGAQNFYTSLLLQDGHELIKIQPPRDLQSWRRVTAEQMMASRLVLLHAPDFEGARGILDSSPFRCFPVARDGALTGVVSREELERSLESGQAPFVQEAFTCYPDQTVGEIADKFVQAPFGVLVVLEETTGRIVGIVTLHDLLRAQAATLE